jgi:hypothetical protein
MFKRAIVFYSKHSTNTQLRYNVAKHLSVVYGDGQNHICVGGATGSDHVRMSNRERRYRP